MPVVAMLAPFGASLILQIACFFLLLRSNLAGKLWLIGFIGMNVFLFLFGFLVPLAWQTGLIDQESAMTLLDRYVSILSIAGSLLLIRFVVVLRAHGRDMDRSGTEAGACASRLPYLPPAWLTVSTVCASAACLLHNINGSIARSIVAAFAPPAPTGAGVASQFAAQLELSAKVADAVGGLYIVTVVLWVSCAGFVAVAVARRRRISSTGGES